MIASYWPSSSLRSRVLTLPRSGIDREQRIALAQLRLAAQARRADARAAGQLREIEIAIRDERVARILARGDRREREALRHVHRHVLQRMHGEIGAALGHRDLELLDEQALAADVGERLVEDPVALRRHAERPTSHAGYSAASRARMCSACHMRERGFARGDREPARWGSVDHGDRERAEATHDAAAANCSPG